MAKHKRGKRRKDRHDKRQKQHAGGGEWDAIVLPEGIEVFKPEDGKTYRLDVIPYIVGPNNPNADEGDEYFEMSYFVYNNLGPDERKAVAVAKQYGDPDPVAELEAEMRRKGMDYKQRSDYLPKPRQLFLVYDHAAADKGVQLFEGARGTFGELLDAQIKQADADEDHITNFDDPEAGATLKVTFKGKNIGQPNPWVKAEAISFKARPDGLEDMDLLDHGVVLDALVKRPTYDEIKQILEGTAAPKPKPGGDDEEGEEPEEKPKRRRRKKEPEPEPEPEDEAPEGPTAADLGITKGDTVTYNGDECSVLRVAKDGLTLTLMDEDDDVHKGVSVEDVETEAPEPEPEPEPEEKPKRTRKKKEPEPEPEPEPEGGDDDDDWDEDWDD